MCFPARWNCVPTHSDFVPGGLSSFPARWISVPASSDYFPARANLVPARVDNSLVFKQFRAYPSVSPYEGRSPRTSRLAHWVHNLIGKSGFEGGTSHTLFNPKTKNHGNQKHESC